MSNRLGGNRKLAYLGTNAFQPPDWVFESRDPNQYDINNTIGDLWLNEADQTVWVLVSLEGTANSKGLLATWIMMTGAGGSVTDLKTDDGNVVTPTLGIINLYGGNGIKTTGTSGPNTATISTDDNVATSYITSPATGTAVPSAGELTFTNGNNITFTAGGSSVAAAVTGTTNHALQLGNATGSLTSLGVAQDGYIPIGSTGADPVLAKLTAGSGISISEGPGSITISATSTPTSATVFYAGLNSALTNVTGDGTTYAVLFDTKIEDSTGSLYDVTTGQFTAPVDGFYNFSTSIAINNIGAGHTFGSITFVRNNGGGPDYLGISQDGLSPAAAQSSNNDLVFQGSLTAIPMSAGDTMQVNLYVANSTKTIGLNGLSTSIYGCTFSGELIDPGLVFGAANYPTDSGTATEIGGDLNILGDHGVLTTGSGNTVTINPPGNQVSFQYYLPTDDNNVTGNSTVYRIGTNVALTQAFDVGSNFNTNGTFTAPATGLYFLGAVVQFRNLSTAVTVGRINIVTSGSSYELDLNIGALTNNFNLASQTISSYVSMNIGDTAIFEVQCENAGSDNVGIAGTGFGGIRLTYVYGYRVA